MAAAARARRPRQRPQLGRDRQSTGHQPHRGPPAVRPPVPGRRRQVALRLLTRQKAGPLQAVTPAPNKSQPGPLQAVMVGPNETVLTTVEATWPQAMVQTCTVHLLRSSMRFVSYADRK